MQQQQQQQENNITLMALAMTTRGSSPLRHGIASLALYIGDSIGNMVESHAWKVAPLSPVQYFETPDASAIATNDRRAAHSAEEVARSIRAIFNARPCAYLVSENACRDASFLNAYLDHFGLAPVTRMHDAFEYARGALCLPFNLQDMNHEHVQHHLPRMQVPVGGQQNGTALETAFKLYLNHISLVRHLMLSQ